MIYNFDEEISRRNTNSLKYDFAHENGYPEDVIPLWVADMDFPAAKPVIEALKRTAEHGIFGYSDAAEGYYEAVSSWFKRNFGWETKREWLVKTPGVVFAVSAAVRAFTEIGDSVLIQTPVYYPFYSVIRDNNRKIIENPLLYANGRYETDFDDFEAKIKKNKVRLFILCSPHNPVGRVWTKEELKKIGDICEKNNVTVISDEIHCDFAFPEHPHTVFPLACPNMRENCVICTAPSKTFNLAGLQTSNIWIPNGELRKKFDFEVNLTGGSLLNPFGLAAAQAAYESGEEWLIQCREYLRGNLDFMRAFLNERLPEIRLTEPDGTYFAWLDCSALGLNCRELNDLVKDKARLWLDAGHIFGDASALFQRVVLACTRKTLREALCRLEKSIREN